MIATNGTFVKRLFTLHVCVYGESVPVVGIEGAESVGDIGVIATLVIDVNYSVIVVVAIGLIWYAIVIVV